MRALCVSIHDVSAPTLSSCRQIAEAVAEIDDSIPLTLLVVPHYHGEDSGSTEFSSWIESRLARGDEVALHGYTHRDEAPRLRGPFDHWRRGVYTAGEGEFAALTKTEAAERISHGRRWLDARGWPATGFVAPAWLLSDGAWAALKESGFLYTTTLTRFHLLKTRVAVPAPTIVYSARNAWRRVVSKRWNDTLAVAARGASLLRFGFHPADAAHPHVIKHALRLLERLGDRHAMTKAAFAERCLANGALAACC